MREPRPVRDQIRQRRAGLLTYGITPPKRSYAPEKLAEIAAAQAARVRQLPVDALVVYDIQDEAARTDVPRPFPFLQCVDAVDYALDALAALPTPKIVYRCVAPLSPPQLASSLKRLDDASCLSVLVGAASSRQATAMRLSDAYPLAERSAPELPIGGVLIAERHAQTGAEDQRAVTKMDAGCRYFITQAVYSVSATKDLLSDLYYRCEAAQRSVPPVLITLSPCGSLRTLDFLRWLGVSIPRWLENDLRRSRDILQASLKVCADVLADLHDFAATHGIPLGCNVESVSLAKVEIEASVELTRLAARTLGRA
ncbi:MAG: 5,10-methylenetetrahydrofolate reductase [Myxococcales bacterium]|nr:MAG: 5,10-methylenetetrahydrofolate reductase [Myxococcales bacterium]